MAMVKVMVAAAMMEVGLVPLSLEEGVSREKGREMVGAEMGGRNVLAHGGFMPIKCIVTGPKV
jgi:hypothetical protein